jgi:Zn-dependent protease with chaperone function
MTRRRHLLRFALLLVTPLLLAQAAPQLPDPGRVSVSKAQQIQLGQQVVAEVYKQMPVLPDSDPLTRYVQQLGRRLEAQIPQDVSWPYNFHVVQQKEVNAFALPGGPVFINVGTITAADNEAELAGVMAHEMSHVYMQHSIKQMQKSQTLGVLAGILGAILPGNTAGNLGRMGIQLGAGVMSLKYSRGDEAQADAVGAILMYKAGYNPKMLAAFFEKLESEGGRGGPQFLSDHPNPGNRMEAIVRETESWPPENYLANSSNEFASMHQRAGSIRAYTAQEISNGAKQGIWARQNQSSGATPPNLPASSGGGAADVGNVSYSQVRPSSSFRQLNQGDFSIGYPSNWQAGNGQNGILIAPPSGVGQNAIAYGVLIGEGQDQNARTLDQATQDLIQNIQQQNQGLRAGSISGINVNGVQGRQAMLSGTSPVQRNGQTVAERDWLVTLPRSQGGLLYLIFIAPDPDFRSLQPTYQKMLRSLQVQ